MDAIKFDQTTTTSPDAQGSVPCQTGVYYKAVEAFASSLDIIGTTMNTQIQGLSFCENEGLKIINTADEKEANMQDAKAGIFSGTSDMQNQVKESSLFSSSSTVLGAEMTQITTGLQTNTSLELAESNAGKRMIHGFDVSAYMPVR